MTVLLMAAPIGIALAVAFWAAWSEVSSLIRWQRSQHPTPPTVEGGIRAVCMTPDCNVRAALPHPDGHAGGVCDFCWMELTK